MLILLSLRLSSPQSLQSSLRSLPTSSRWPHHRPLLLSLLLLLFIKLTEVAEVEAVGEVAEAADYQDHHLCQYQVPQPSTVGRTLLASTILSGAEPQL